MPDLSRLDRTRLLVTCECGWRVHLGGDVTTADYVTELTARHRADPSQPALPPGLSRGG